MPSIYHPRRPRASPLWQIVHQCWDEFVAHYETRHRKIYGPLRRDSVTVVNQFNRCGDLAAGFTRLQCPDCGHEKLLAFTCKTRHFCPSCHQRRVCHMGDWIAREVCFDVPHRQFVFTARKVIYRSKRSWHTKRNFQIFTATDFLAAAVEHIPPKHQQTVRYYGLYSNKRRGMDAKAGRPRPRMREAATTLRPPSNQPTLVILPPPSPGSVRALRPLWRDLIMKVWGEDPLLCPCCKGTMKVIGTMIRREEVEFFLRLHGLWEGLIALPPPPAPPFDVESMEPLDVPPQWGWSDEVEAPPEDWWLGEGPVWEAPELALDEERILVLDADDPFPPDEWPAQAANDR